MASVLKHPGGGYRVSWFDPEHQLHQEYYYGERAFSLAHRRKNEIENLIPDGRLIPKIQKKKGRASKTGRIGVFYQKGYKKTSGKDVYPYYYVSIHYDRNGNQRRRTATFSVIKYGEENAFKLACELRQMYEECIDPFDMERFWDFKDAQREGW